MRQDFQSSDLNDVRVHSVELGEGLKGFVYISRRNTPYIFVDESLSPESTAETIAHETYHLRYDKISHGIGLDSQRDDPELRAREFAVKNTQKVLRFMNPI